MAFAEDLLTLQLLIMLHYQKMTMTPEEKARQRIDRMFAEAGWEVINREEYSAGMTAVAIREGLLLGNKEADYFLFLNGKAVGVLEAKREEIDVTARAVERPSRKLCP